MKERPILMTGAMVRAVLDDRKTQTRRICKPAENAALSRVIPAYNSNNGEQRPPYITPGWFGDEEGDVLFSSPYGVSDDRLLVRESARVKAVRGGLREIDIEYQADGLAVTVKYPSRLAPAPLGKLLSNGTYREASRILLEITNVRVERLNDISETDAQAEGVERRIIGEGWREYGLDKQTEAYGTPPLISAKESFHSLWESINGPGSWDVNPWVWVIEFKVLP